ncbi:type IV secretion system protein [Avibacterium endocarditidis]|uniref:type IV secretion system protein n=1 Tax=Avibacterium endocarditidis TaxID=380674 RepID=UPI0039FC2A9F
MSDSFIANTYTKVVETFVKNVDTYAGSIASQARPVIAAAFLLYMLYVVYRMYSKKDALWEEFTNKIILFAIVGAFAAIGEHYSNVISFVLNAGDELASKLSSNATNSVSSVDNAYNAFQQGIDLLKKKSADTSWWQSFSGENIEAIIAMCFLYVAQFIFSIVIAVNLLIAKIMVVLLLSVGIIFISFVVFPATRNMFFSFVGLCFNYIFLNVLYSVAAKLSSDYILDTVSPTGNAMEIIGNAAEALVTVAILVLAINQIPTLVSSLTGGVGISAFTINPSSFSKMASLAKQGLFGKNGGRKGLINGAASMGKKAIGAWKNRGSGKASSAK